MRSSPSTSKSPTLPGDPFLRLLDSLHDLLGLPAPKPDLEYPAGGRDPRPEGRIGVGGSLNQSFRYEEKIDNMTLQLEELVLDVLMAALRKILERNDLFTTLEKKSAEKNPDF
jgi:hypothetical protein